jgi:hypothetical protein
LGWAPAARIAIFLAAPRIAHLIGLLAAMVFTHLPSNLLLAALAFAPNLPAAVGLPLARTVLSQMDVPTRQAYVMVLVPAVQRTRAAAVTNTARYVTRPAATALLGRAQLVAPGLPFLLAGIIKIGYDLTLWALFRHIRLTEPAPGRTPPARLMKWGHPRPAPGLRRRLRTVSHRAAEGRPSADTPSRSGQAVYPRVVWPDFCPQHDAGTSPQLGRHCQQSLGGGPVMIGWSTIGYGAALSAVAAGVLVSAVARGHRMAAGLAAAIGAAAGPVIWNAILRATHADAFFTDAPVVVMPASWQDTGSGVFAFTVTALLLGLGPLGAGPARRTVAYALLAGVAAFLVDVYLY